ncbi:hypothetical protein [Pseudoalteromonas luteoviolacea]|uniref:Uncharacterized protein n=1 Tax=Pseudoalteromonas luteoviolacea (strain 2ta16) TaxID=1353533 RepID=V4JA11_PSEL2|nr:hypothetical protein [Pseudoalteromonas luteoviolacea]ESP92022.1 hypothetical protein PL2TA16_04858 [Pseudoalteromonas luteoviolacea 2ta16]KZN29127.1 hypothetical protein N483_06770 [Pseudoalteromonas luteoviolacea NCIMB 1944]
MKKHIAAVLLLAPLFTSASSQEVKEDQVTSSAYGKITICQYEHIGSSFPESGSFPGTMVSFTHQGHIQCRGPVYVSGFRYVLDSQTHTYGRYR